jgi:hypothetical protein
LIPKFTFPLSDSPCSIDFPIQKRLLISPKSSLRKVPDNVKIQSLNSGRELVFIQGRNDEDVSETMKLVLKELSENAIIQSIPLLDDCKLLLQSLESELSFMDKSLRSCLQEFNDFIVIAENSQDSLEETNTRAVRESIQKYFSFFRPTVVDLQIKTDVAALRLSSFI